MKPYAALIAALLLAAPALADASPAVESFMLDNGMEVVVIPNHRVPAVSHMMWFRVGSADDPPGKSGLAHFHEHLMFQGTAQYKPGEYADIIARNGGEQNAFTGYDMTSYYVDVAKDRLPLIMDMEADRLRGLTPPDAEVTREKQVILEERRLRVENSPHALLGEQMNAALFRHHPYHLPVIGWMHEMEKLTKTDVLEFHRRWYHASNAILVVSGDITANDLKPLAEKYYGGLPRRPVPARFWNDEPPQIAARRITLHHANVTQPAFRRAYTADSLGHGEKANALPLFVLSQALGGSKTSRLYQALVVDRKLATEIATGYNGFAMGPAQFEIEAVPEQGVSLQTLEGAIDEQLALLLKDGLTEPEIKRAKTLLKAESVYARDGLASMARIMGQIRIVGLDKNYFTRWPEMIEAVTPEQASHAAKSVLRPAASVTGWLLPEETP